MKSWQKIIAAKEAQELKKKREAYDANQKLADEQEIKKHEKAKNKLQTATAIHAHAKENKTVDLESKKENLIYAKLNFQFLRERKAEFNQLTEQKPVSQSKFQVSETKKMRLFERAKYERKLAQTTEKSIFDTANAPVNIRNIFIVQDRSGSKIGEFDFPRIRETEDQLIDRMMKTIQAISAEGCHIHMENNFSYAPYAPFLMKDNKKNEITRMVFHEFSFYPNEFHGPLSIAGFNKLIEKIKLLAATYPENFHLLLATFPIKDEENNLHNVALYVQCGAEPIVTYTVKALPANSDLVYPKTRLAYVSGGSRAETMMESLKNKAKTLVSQLYLDRHKNLHASVVDGFESACLDNKDYPPPKRLIDALEELKSRVEKKHLTFADAINYCRIICREMGFKDKSESIEKQVKNALSSYNKGNYSHFIEMFAQEEEILSPALSKTLIAIKDKLDKKQNLSLDNKVALDEARRKILKSYEFKDQYLKRIRTEPGLKNLLDFYEYLNQMAWPADFLIILERVKTAYKNKQPIDPNEQKLLEQIRAINQHLEPSYGFVDKICSRSEGFVDQLQKVFRKKTSAIFSVTIPGVAAELSKNVKCVTAGRAVFTTDIDICVEHEFGVAKISKELKIQEQAFHNTYLPTLASHVLTANSITYQLENAISSVVEHADAKTARTRLTEIQEAKSVKTATLTYAKKTNTISNLPFGSNVTLHYFNPIPITLLMGDLQEEVNLYNEILHDFLVLKRLYASYPNLRPIYNQCILLHALESFSQMAQQILNYQSQPEFRKFQQLINLVLDKVKRGKDPEHSEIISIGNDINDFLKVESFKFRSLFVLTQSMLIEYLNNSGTLEDQLSPNISSVKQSPNNKR